MKNLRYTIIIILSIVLKKNYAQNLVPNPSFETYTSCPNASSQISFAYPWQGVTTNSVDYFSSCSSTYTGVPRCGAGWQYARTGGAYGAIWTINGLGTNYREYLQVKLDSALIQDSCYFVEFYCNVYNLSCFGINKLGAYLSNSAINSVGPGLVLQYTPQIISNVFLSDTLNWMRVSGYYKAIGGEQYITVGNFNTDATTDTINVRNSGCSGSYYLIDDVSITKIQGCDTLGTGINESKNSMSFNLFPNPNNGNMTLEYRINASDIALLEITDLTGKVIAKYELSGNSTTIQLHNDLLESGMYIYHIEVNNKVVKSDKLLIIK